MAHNHRDKAAGNGVHSPADKGYSVELGGQLIAAEAAGIAGRQQNATDLQIHHLDVSFYSISNISLISQSEKGGMLHAVHFFQAAV